MKIFEIMRKERSCYGHGDTRETWELASYKFFKTKELAEQYIKDDELKPDLDRIGPNGYYVKGKSYLSRCIIKVFELIGE